MNALDTSVCIPALLSWHEHHESSRAAASGSSIPAHTMLEAYSVLTRLPSPHRVDGSTATTLLSAWFSGERILTPPVGLQRRLVDSLAGVGIEGGAVYDGLIGLTARHHGLTLLTRDRRAATTYEVLDVDYQLLES